MVLYYFSKPCFLVKNGLVGLLGWRGGLRLVCCRGMDGGDRGSDGELIV